MVERREMTREQAAACRKWMHNAGRTLLLYGVDWLNPSLYDLTLNLENMTIDSAVEIAAAAVRCREFSATDQSRKAMDDLLLVTRASAAFAADPLLALSEIEVQADSASATIFLKGKLPASLVKPVVIREVSVKVNKNRSTASTRRSDSKHAFPLGLHIRAKINGRGRAAFNSFSCHSHKQIVQLQLLNFPNLLLRK
jgi:hypothetical protein